MRVRVLDLHNDAKKMVGYYDLQRMRAGDVFDLDDEKDFSKRWMEKVDEKTPLTRRKIHYERAEEKKAIENLNVI